MDRILKDKDRICHLFSFNQKDAILCVYHKDANVVLTLKVKTHSVRYTPHLQKLTYKCHNADITKTVNSMLRGKTLLECLCGEKFRTLLRETIRKEKP